MRVRQRRLRHAAVLCFSIAAFLVCVTTPARGAESIPVIASLSPLGWLAEQVGGDRVAVRVLIPPGRNPHHFEPTPGDLRGLREARLVLRVGHGSFGFEERLLEPLLRQQETGEQASVVRLDLAAGAAGVPLGEDPHLWLSPPVLVEMAGRVVEALATVDPAGAAHYRKRGAVLQEKLRVLDARLRKVLSASPCRTFLVDHPAWGSFAAHYSLTQLALEIDGKEPGPASLVRVIREADQARVRLLLVEPGKPGGSTVTVTRTLGAEVQVIDPLMADIPANLERMARLVAEGCERE
jgi:zinc transport system substrate-binding protein